MSGEKRARKQSRYGAKGVAWRYSGEVGECISACREGRRGAYDEASARFWRRYPAMRAEGRRVARRWGVDEHEALQDEAMLLAA